MRAYIVTTSQNVQPLTSGMRWKIVQMKTKPATWVRMAAKMSTTKSAW